MKIILNKIYHFFKAVYVETKKSIESTLEEASTIIRNRKYIQEYPELFAIFSILEHEQSSAVFDVNLDDFNLIKNDILHDPNVNNAQILDCLRSLFQNIQLAQNKNATENQIAKYLYDKLIGLINKNNDYYIPLAKALIQGFPFVLNYNNYELLKILLKQKNKRSLKLIKHILDKESFYNFFLRNKDAVNALFIAREFDNKLAFLLLIRFLRKNNLLETLYDDNANNIRVHIANMSLVEKLGIEYCAIVLSYLENKRFTSEIKMEIERFFDEIFSHHFGLEQFEKEKGYTTLTQTIIMAKRIGYDNSQMQDILDLTASRYITKNNDKKMLKNYITKIQIGPATTVKLRDFFALAPLSPEEYMILKYAPYLL